MELHGGVSGVALESQGVGLHRGPSTHGRRGSSAAILVRRGSQLAVHAGRAAHRGIGFLPQALIAFALVLLLGGGIFSALEGDTETAHRRELAIFLRRMHAALNASDFEDLVAHLGLRDDRVAEELVAANLSHPHEPALAPRDWDFVGACFFCFTAATTIGYGNYTPRTRGGKSFLVLYAIFAIPTCLMAFAQISDRALELLARRFRRRMVFEGRVASVFRMFDADGSNALDRHEVRQAMRSLGYCVDDVDGAFALNERFERGFAACDSNGDVRR